MSPEEHFFDLLPAYALGSLDEEEQLQVSRHLAMCAICRAELQDFDQIVEHLPLAIVQSEPAGDVKDKIMAYARKDKDSAQITPEQTWWARLTQAMRVSAPVWGIASLLLIFILGLSNLFLWGRLNEIERVSQSVLLSIPLQGTDATPQAVGMLVVSQDGEHGTLVGGQQAADDPQQGRLAAAIRPDDRDDLALSHAHAEVRERGQAHAVDLEAARDSVELDGLQVV